MRLVFFLCIALSLSLFGADEKFMYDTTEEAKPYTGPIRDLTRSPLQDVVDSAKEGYYHQT